MSWEKVILNSAQRGKKESRSLYLFCPKQITMLVENYLKFKFATQIALLLKVKAKRRGIDMKPKLEPFLLMAGVSELCKKQRLTSEILSYAFFQLLNFALSLSASPQLSCMHWKICFDQNNLPLTAVPEAWSIGF